MQWLLGNYYNVGQECYSLQKFPEKQNSFKRTATSLWPLTHLTPGPTLKPYRQLSKMSYLTMNLDCRNLEQFKKPCMCGMFLFSTWTVHQRCWSVQGYLWRCRLIIRESKITYRSTGISSFAEYRRMQVSSINACLLEYLTYIAYIKVSRIKGTIT